ncbi:hypothetical protein L1987_00547 [Smallanthus sonchifolius]|uniref:Uncharacterized protein n=1 Tax=Smallanthus sonchifolius TaxID=185202 RepID=A0ACB9K2L3_9ASTR|nr:hypothetical protein L1987_00547 [Smallanthus sonchifolius]
MENQTLSCVGGFTAAEQQFADNGFEQNRTAIDSREGFRDVRMRLRRLNNESSCVKLGDIAGNDCVEGVLLQWVLPVHI